VNHGFDMTKDQDPSLINPNQLRMNDILVDDIPVHLSKNELGHCIYVSELEIRLLLELDGVISYLPTRLPTAVELEQCQHIALTSVVP
jgi:hypothetical protein